AGDSARRPPPPAGRGRARPRGRGRPRRPLAHLLLSPLVFSRETVEAFEFPKVMLLVAAAIAAAALAPWRFTPRALLRDPLQVGVVLFMLSAGVSTALSRAPWISLQGAGDSYFGLLTVVAYVVLFFATRALCRTAD